MTSVPVRIAVVRTDADPDAPRRWATHRLGAAEAARADAYLRPADRNVTIAAALLVRAIAGQALEVSPDEVLVERRCTDCGGPHGAPFVVGAPRFSVSHCDGFAVVAACDRPVGVDIEPADRTGVRGVASMLLGPGEAPCDDDAALLRTWVRKEAVVKATGVGLTVPLGEVQVTPPHLPPAVVRYGPAPGLAVALADVPLDDALLAVAVLTDRPLDVRVEDGAALVRGEGVPLPAPGARRSFPGRDLACATPAMRAGTFAVDPLPNPATGIS